MTNKLLWLALLPALLLSCSKSEWVEVPPEVQVASKRIGDDNYSKIIQVSHPQFFHHTLLIMGFQEGCIDGPYQNCIEIVVRGSAYDQGGTELDEALAANTVHQYFDTGNWHEYFPYLADTFAHWRTGLVNQSMTLARIDGDTVTNAQQDPQHIFEITSVADQSKVGYLIIEFDQQ